MEMVTSLLGYLFTPTGIFCVLNIVIGSIYFTSRLNKLQHHGGGAHQDDPVVYSAAPQPQQLRRAPSLLDRVRSINFSSYLLPEQPVPVSSGYRLDPHEAQGQKAEETTDDRVAVMERSLSEAAATSCKEAPPAERMRKSASEKGVVVVEEQEKEDKRQQEVAMGSERRDKWSRTTTAAAVVGEDEAVDEKADDFINRFRQQLKLQRLDSILRYREMLNRGAGR